MNLNNDDIMSLYILMFNSFKNNTIPDYFTLDSFQDLFCKITSTLNTNMYNPEKKYKYIKGEGCYIKLLDQFHIPVNNTKTKVNYKINFNMFHEDII